MAGYLGSTPVPQATQHRESFTATSGQTTFATAGYTAGFVDVYLNGSHLSPADFTATNGSDVVLASGASADDVCDIISHSAFEVNAQTFTGTTTMDVVTVGGTLGVAGLVSPAAGITVVGSTTVDDIILTAVALPAAGVPSLALRNTDNNVYLQSGSGNSVTLLDSTHDTLAHFHEDEIQLNIDGSTRLKIDATGAVTMPLQPAFQVVPASIQANFPINAVTQVVFGTERFDQNADFASNTFTAPVVGKYLLTTTLRVDNVDKAYGNIQVKILTSNKDYYSIINPAIYAQDATLESLSLTILADMDASDTALVAIYISNNGTAQADVQTDSYFSGYLVA